MKLAILVTLISMCGISFACEQQEAQVIAEVTRVETDSLTYCKAYIDSTSTTMYNEHGLCPLDLSEVESEGINFPLINGHDCEIYRGDSLTGYLVKKNGRIYLD